MSIHLDTSTVIAIFKNEPAATRHRFGEARDRGETIVVSSIVLFELWFGAAKSNRWQENAKRIRDFLGSGIGVVPFDADVAQIAGELRETLKSGGAPIGPYDLLIAAQAVRRDATLVTANVAEFSRVPGLKWQDWSVP